MSEGSRWLASVALYALAVMLMAPLLYYGVGLYMMLWGVPWPSQDWTLGQSFVAWLFWTLGIIPLTQAMKLGR